MMRETITDIWGLHILATLNRRGQMCNGRQRQDAYDFLPELWHIFAALHSQYADLAR